MKKIIIVAFALISFSVFAENTNNFESITTQNYSDKSTGRVHQNYQNKDTGDFFNVVYLINYNTDSKAEPKIDIVITTKSGQLVIGNESSELIGDFDFAGIEAKSLNSSMKEMLFFSDPVFDHFLNSHLTSLDQVNVLNKNYSSNECNDLASAINQVMAEYMHLRRTSNDDDAINYARGVVMGMVMEYNGNC